MTEINPMAFMVVDGKLFLNYNDTVLSGCRISPAISERPMTIGRRP